MSFSQFPCGCKMTAGTLTRATSKHRKEIKEPFCLCLSPQGGKSSPDVPLPVVSLMDRTPAKEGGNVSMGHIQPQ